jgi:CheY-like chemotaxis protein
MSLLIELAAGDPPCRAAASGPRILIVDDEQDLRETLGDLLSAAGYLVTTADSGANALAAARTDRFDLLLTDLRMPGMDGADTLTAIKQIDPEIRVVVVTGYSSEEVAADCHRRGADEVVPKPFEFDALLHLVERLLRPRD